MPHAGAAKTSPPHTPDAAPCPGAVTGSRTRPTSPDAASSPATARASGASSSCSASSPGSARRPSSALLHLVEHLAFGYRSGPFLDGVAAAAGWRRVVALVVAAVVVARRHLRPRTPARCRAGTEVSEAVWLRGAHMAVRAEHRPRRDLDRHRRARGRRWAARALRSSSARPRLRAGCRTGAGCRPGSGACWWRPGAGAGFAAVYNVPLGGALFALEVLLGTLALPLVLPALATSVIATCVAWITLGTGPTYRLPSYAVHPQQLAWAALAGPDHRRGGDRLGAHHRLGRLAPADGTRALRGAVRRLPHPRAGLDQVPGAARQRQGRRPARRARRSISFGLSLDPVHPQAAGHGGVPVDRLAGRPVHADADDRRPAGRDPGLRVARTSSRVPGRAATRSSAAAPSWPPRCRGRCRAWSWCSSSPATSTR